MEIPTGVGKTALFVSLVKNYLEATKNIDDAPRVLITVPSTDLVIQTAKSIAKFMPEVAKKIEADDDKGDVIDWEKSDIGVQYSKKKHADQKPKVLITTYQSLCKDNENKTYPPDDYGFVIYDEGHNITANKFGQAVDKFKDAIQLAVTATPEYSEEKRVGEKLARRYYSLFLGEAINRGDLCQVDPHLIKTGYTIDKQKFEQFLVQQNGRPFTQKQYETLLNQESRNTAAIKTYLLGEDAYTGERYLGQTGMIFAGGIAHCNDFVRQINKVLDTPQYKPVKDWLAKEGIALVAPLHSRIKTFDLTIDGEKKSYTKDEIKDLHRKGKVLLLVSDKELKEGTDFPRDSIIMELVDRLSVVDATQRYGRGFRLNYPDPENNDPGDPDKRCKVFNLVDENTYDIYKDAPDMLPIYCSEVLTGAEFREPIKRPHLIKRFKEKLPNVDDSLSAAGFEVITDINQVREASERLRQLQVNYPDKTGDWLSVTEASSYAGVSRNGNRNGNKSQSDSSKKLADLFEQSQKAVDAKEEHFQFNDVNVQSGYFKTESKRVVFCVHKDTLDALGLKAQEVMGKKEDHPDMLAMRQTQQEAKADKASSRGKAIKTVFDACEREYKRQQEAGITDITVEYNGATIDCGYLKPPKGKAVFCIHRDNLQEFLAEYPDKSEHTDFKTMSDFIASSRATNDSERVEAINQMYQFLEEHVDKANTGEQTVTWEDHPISCRIVKSGRPIMVVNEKHVSDFLSEKHQKAAQANDPDFVTLTEYLGQNDIGHSTSLAQPIREVFQEAQKSYDGGNTVKIGNRTLDCAYREGRHFTIRSTHVDQLGLIPQEKTSEWLSIGDFRNAMGGIRGETELGKYVSSLFSQTEKQFTNGGEVVFENTPIKCGNYIDKTTGKQTFCIHESAVNDLGLATQPDGYLSVREFQRAAKTTQQRTRGKKIEAFFDQLEQKNDQSGAVAVDGKNIECGYFTKAGKKRFCVHSSEVEKFPAPDTISPNSTTIAQSDGPANSKKKNKGHG